MKLKITKKVSKPAPRIVDMGDGTTYPFAPEKKGGPFVCEVSKSAHVSKLMVSGSYAPLDDGEDMPEPPVQDVDIDTDTDAVAEALAGGAQTKEPDPEDAQQGQEDAANAGQQEDEGEDLSEIEKLRAAYEAKFGEKPHHNTGEAKLRAMLEAPAEPAEPAEDNAGEAPSQDDITEDTSEA